MTRRRRSPLPRLPRLSRRPQQLFFLIVAVVVVLLWRFWPGGIPSLGPPPSATEAYRVARVVDGDTLLLADRQRVRLIGVDTPETVKPDAPVEPWGPEAAEFTRAFVARGEVALQFDGQRHDKYGRLLAYVWVGERMLNEELVRAGLARAKTQYTYDAAIKARFVAAETEAKVARRGIWSK